MERVIRNLINRPWLLQKLRTLLRILQVQCHRFVHNVRAAIQLPNPTDLPPFIDNPEEFMPKKLPNTDLCLASGSHNDLLLELPEHMKKAGIKTLIAPIEDWQELHTGVRKQLEIKCKELGARG